MRHILYVYFRDLVHPTNKMKETYCVIHEDLRFHRNLSYNAIKVLPKGIFSNLSDINDV